MCQPVRWNAVYLHSAHSVVHFRHFFPIFNHFSLGDRLSLRPNKEDGSRSPAFAVEKKRFLVRGTCVIQRRGGEAERLRYAAKNRSRCDAIPFICIFRICAAIARRLHSRSLGRSLIARIFAEQQANRLRADQYLRCANAGSTLRLGERSSISLLSLRLRIAYWLWHSKSRPSSEKSLFEIESFGGHKNGPRDRNATDTAARKPETKTKRRDANEQNRMEL